MGSQEEGIGTDPGGSIKGHIIIQGLSLLTTFKTKLFIILPEGVDDIFHHMEGERHPFC